MKCKQKIRRIPLNGKCPRCGESLRLSVYKNMILKYFGIAQQIIRELDPGDFRVQQFNRFIITDYRVLSVATDGDLIEFLNNKGKERRIEHVDKKAIVKKVKVDLSYFI